MIQEQKYLAELSKRIEELIKKTSGASGSNETQVLQSQSQLIEALIVAGGATLNKQNSDLLLKSPLLRQLVSAISHSNKEVGLHALANLTGLICPQQDDTDPLVIQLLGKINFVQKSFDLLQRLDESKEFELRGIYQLLKSYNQIITEGVQFQLNRLLVWLINRIKFGPQDEIQLFCAQIVQVLLTSKPQNSRIFSQLGGFQTIFQLLYKSIGKSPSSPANHQTLLYCLEIINAGSLEESTIKQYVDKQVCYLLLKLVKDKGVTSCSSLRVLAQLLKVIPLEVDNLIQNKCLGIICPILMGKGLSPKKIPQQQSVIQAASIILSLLALFSTGPKLRRVLDKILQKRHQKLFKLKEKAYEKLGFEDEPKSAEEYWLRVERGRKLAQSFCIVGLVLEREGRLPQSFKEISLMSSCLNTKVKFMGQGLIRSKLIELVPTKK